MTFLSFEGEAGTSSANRFPLPLDGDSGMAEASDDEVSYGVDFLLSGSHSSLSPTLRLFRFRFRLPCKSSHSLISSIRPSISKVILGFGEFMKRAADAKHKIM